MNGKLVDLKTSSFEEVPDWEEAARNIALTNITKFPQNLPVDFPVWPGSPLVCRVRRSRD